MVITGNDNTILKKFLGLAPEPENALSYDQLTGFLYGIAITPDTLLPSEWIPLIFAGKTPEFATLDQAGETCDGLVQVLNTFTAAFHDGSLAFPFDIFSSRAETFDAILDWTLGFDLALSLRPDIWDPDESTALPPGMVHDVLSSLMVVEGLLAPEIRNVVFDRLPQEIMKEAVTETDAALDDTPDRQLAVLLFTLPMAIDQLQKYAGFLDEMKTRGLGKNGEEGTPEEKATAPAAMGKLIHGRFPRSRR
ncbi:MAG TPA: UPF0149 family protein [Desulfoprunum sp.]|nr:UPF0149 family protein [Desulfoprunum sp.]